MKTQFAIFCVIVIAALAFVGKPAPSVTKTPETKSPAITKGEAVMEAEFQTFVRQVAALKASMKNPASFKLEEAQSPKVGTLCVTYRATNSFNAVVPGYALLLDGKAITSDNREKFVPLWNKHCAGKPGNDFTHIRQALR